MAGATMRRFVYLQIATFFQHLQDSIQPGDMGKGAAQGVEASRTVKLARRLRSIHAHTHRAAAMVGSDPSGLARAPGRTHNEHRCYPMSPVPEGIVQETQRRVRPFGDHLLSRFPGLLPGWEGRRAGPVRSITVSTEHRCLNCQKGLIRREAKKGERERNPLVGMQRISGL